MIGADPLHSSPILDLRIRKAVHRNGTELAVATERPTALDGGAAAVARYAPGGAAGFLTDLGEPSSPTAQGLRPGHAELAGGSPRPRT